MWQSKNIFLLLQKAELQSIQVREGYSDVHWEPDVRSKIIILGI